MAAVTSQAFSFEEIDVFTVPHNRMKKLLADVSNQVFLLIIHQSEINAK